MRNAWRVWHVHAQTMRKKRRFLLAAIQRIENRGVVKAINRWIAWTRDERREERRLKKLRATRERLLRQEEQKKLGRRRGKGGAKGTITAMERGEMQEREAWELLSGLPRECVRRFAFGV